MTYKNIKETRKFARAKFDNLFLLKSMNLSEVANIVNKTIQQQRRPFVYNQN